MIINECFGLRFGYLFCTPREMLQKSHASQTASAMEVLGTDRGVFDKGRGRRQMPDGFHEVD